MPLTVSISVAQNSGLPNVIVLTDNSTGSDPGITERRVYLYKADNTTLVPSGTTTPYTVWPIADTSISLDVLTKDTSLTIVVKWLTGLSATYTYTNYYQFPAYGKSFLYNLTVTQQLSFPDIVKDTQYLFNKLQLYTYLKDAENAIAEGGDVMKAQLAFDLGTYMMNNSQIFF